LEAGKETGDGVLIMYNTAGNGGFYIKKLPPFPGFLLLPGRRRMRKFRISVKYPPDTFSVTGA
jgi:hypothetical protein